MRIEHRSLLFHRGQRRRQVGRCSVKKARGMQMDAILPTTKYLVKRLPNRTRGDKKIDRPFSSLRLVLKKPPNPGSQQPEASAKNTRLRAKAASRPSYPNT